MAASKVLGEETVADAVEQEYDQSLSQSQS
jgi:hypothetical protein